MIKRSTSAEEGSFFIRGEFRAIFIEMHARKSTLHHGKEATCRVGSTFETLCILRHIQSHAKMLFLGCLWVNSRNLGTAFVQGSAVWKEIAEEDLHSKGGRTDGRVTRTGYLPSFLLPFCSLAHMSITFAACIMRAFSLPPSTPSSVPRSRTKSLVCAALQLACPPHLYYYSTFVIQG